MNVIYTYLIPLCSFILIPIIRVVYMKFVSIETELDQKISRDDAKQLVMDKLDPVKENLMELKEKIDKIFDKLLERK